MVDAPLYDHIRPGEGVYAYYSDRLRNAIIKIQPKPEEYPFEDKTVADIGCRDGRYANVFRTLGAKNVIGIDPDSTALDEAVQKGIFTEGEVYRQRLQDTPTDLRFDIAAVLNVSPYEPAPSERESYIDEILKRLNDDGILILTFIEIETYRQYAYILSTKANIINQIIVDRLLSLESSSSPNKSSEMVLPESLRQEPHAYIIIARK